MSGRLAKWPGFVYFELHIIKNNHLRVIVSCQALITRSDEIRRFFIRTTDQFSCDFLLRDIV